jgi:energy-coupling factor transporter ATP-binding protein EcfA2
VCRSAENVGYVPRDDTIHPALPLARALWYAALLRGVAQPDAAAAAVMRDLDLAGRSAVPVGDLSGGERKRAAIAAELLAKPGVFFLDEPTTGLDPARGRELMRVLRGLCDSGVTVVLTTRSPLDADRCDKVAVLATGGDLAFFGAPAAARDYFGADSLDEIYERLAGLGDPAAAWSRRFFHFSRTIGGFYLVPTVPPQPGPARLVPDSAGPHSAGPVSTGLLGDDLLGDDLAGDNLAADIATSDPGQTGADEPAADDGPAAVAVAAPGGLSGGARDRLPNATATGPTSGMAARLLRPLRQWAVLTRRNAEAAVRSGRALAALAGPPVAVLLTFGVLSLRGGTVTTSFWAAFGGFFVGLAYGLPQVRAEIGVLRRERSAGLGAGAYVLAKATAALPLLGGADAVLAVAGRAVGHPPPGGGYGSTFLTTLLSSAAALGLGLLISAAFSARAPVPAAVTMFCLPQLLFAAAVFTLLDRPVWGNWLVLAVFAVAFFAAAAALITRTAPACTAPPSPAQPPRSSPAHLGK